MTLERSGTRDRTARRMERRTEQQGRDLDQRIDALNPSTGTTFMGGTILEVDLTTTPAEFAHGLRQQNNAPADPRVRVYVRPTYEGRAWQGVWLCGVRDGTFDLVVEASSDDTKYVKLSVTSGSHTVKVAVV